MSAQAPATAPIFRRAEAADVDAVVALVESAYRGEASRAGWTTEADLLDGRRTGADEIAALLADPHSLLLLACRNDNIGDDTLPDDTLRVDTTADGTLLASAHVQRRDAIAYFGMFAVRPGLQGRGVGRAVLAEAERIARDEWLCTSMRMTVIVQRAALIDWYLRRGYARTGEYAPFPYGDARFGIPRRDDLRFETLAKSLR